MSSSARSVQHLAARPDESARAGDSALPGGSALPPRQVGRSLARLAAPRRWRCLREGGRDRDGALAGAEEAARGPQPKRALPRPVGQHQADRAATRSGRFHAATHTTWPRERMQHKAKKSNPHKQKKQPANARTTRWKNRRKGDRDEDDKKQNDVKTLEIHDIIMIPTTPRTRRKTPRRRRQNPEVRRGSKTDGFPFISHVKM